MTTHEIFGLSQSARCRWVLSPKEPGMALGGTARRAEYGTMHDPKMSGKQGNFSRSPFGTVSA